MTDADSIWESKLSRLQDPNLEKIQTSYGAYGRIEGEEDPDLRLLPVQRAHQVADVPGSHLAGLDLDEYALGVFPPSKKLITPSIPWSAPFLPVFPPALFAPRGWLGSGTTPTTGTGSGRPGRAGEHRPGPPAPRGP